jgi:hypothetical protein
MVIAMRRPWNSACVRKANRRSPPPWSRSCCVRRQFSSRWVIFFRTYNTLLHHLLELYAVASKDGQKAPHLPYNILEQSYVGIIRSREPDPQAKAKAMSANAPLGPVSIAGVSNQAFYIAFIQGSIYQLWQK